MACQQREPRWRKSSRSQPNGTWSRIPTSARARFAPRRKCGPPDVLAAGQPADQPGPRFLARDVDQRIEVVHQLCTGSDGLFLGSSAHQSPARIFEEFVIGVGHPQHFTDD